MAKPLIKYDVRGFRMVRRRLQNKLRTATFNIQAGVREGALMIQRASQKKTPVVTGNLKASAYAASYMDPRGPAAEIGYTSFYAVFVHQSEGTGKQGWRNVKGRPQKYSYVGEWKFLEKAVEEKKEAVREVIARKADFRTGGQTV